MAHISRMEEGERKQQLFLRGMTDGNLAERDRLLYYTVGEFYNEMSLFVQEQEERKAELDKTRGKF